MKRFVIIGILFLVFATSSIIACSKTKVEMEHPPVACTIQIIYLEEGKIGTVVTNNNAELDFIKKLVQVQGWIVKPMEEPYGDIGNCHLKFTYNDEFPDSLDIWLIYKREFAAGVAIPLKKGERKPALYARAIAAISKKITPWEDIEDNVKAQKDKRKGGKR